MEFSHFLSSYLPDPSYGGKRLFADMVEQATTAERLGYRSVTIPEHHLINILLTPSPLQMAVKVASVTERLELVTSVVVLPIRDKLERAYDYYKRFHNVRERNPSVVTRGYIEAMERFAAQVMPHFTGNRESEVRDSAA